MKTLFFLLVLAAHAAAQITLTLSPAVTPNPPGCLFTVTGTIQNSSGPAVFLNGLNLSSQDDSVTLDSTPFTSAPLTLAAGASFTGPLFTVASPAGGQHELTVALTGGLDANAGGVLAQLTTTASDAFAEALAPSPLHSRAARLAGRASPGCAAGSVRFRFGTSAGTLTQLTPSIPLASGLLTRISADLNGLNPLVTYFVQAVTTTAAGDFASEIISFTTPADDPAAPPLALHMNADATRTVCFTGTPATAFRVEHSGDLSTWQLLQHATSDSAGTLLVTDTTVPAPARTFYRVIPVP